ncbi:MAG: GGDEF domain-containing protein [Thermomonas sp.]|uniref:GGDEF domain-containing protein n=1 Tax=Thermomonas sp. TaxID=1971895 RepID=UPI0039E27AF3
MRFTVVVGFLLLHALVIGFAPPWASNLMQAAAGLLAVGVAMRCGQCHGWALARGWSLLAMAWLLWVLGMLLGLQQRMSGVDVPFPVAAGVLYLLGILPMVLAISIVGLGRRDNLLRVIDSGLVAILGALYCGIRLGLFGAGFGEVDPVLLADMQNVFLVLLAGVRRAAAENDDELRFFGLLFPFLLLRFAATFLYNRMVQADPALTAAWVQLLPVLPFMLVVVLAASPRPPRMWLGAVRLAPFARAASPLAVTVLVLVMSALVVARGATMVGIVGIVLGVFGYGFRSTLLLVRTEAAVRRLHKLSRIDDLTGIANRRRFEETAGQAWLHAAQTGQPLALMMIDIDHFKSLNDRYGHNVGDDCLRKVAGVLTAIMADAPGMVARIGGEEFAVVVPGSDLDAAAQLAERMRAAVQALEKPLPDPAQQVTVSIGVADAWPREERGLPLALMLADRMLYEAKRQGRNRVCAAEDRDAGAGLPATSQEVTPQAAPAAPH